MSREPQYEHLDPVDREADRYDRDCERADVAWKERDEPSWFERACEAVDDLDVNLDIDTAIAQRDLANRP